MLMDYIFLKEKERDLGELGEQDILIFLIAKREDRIG